MDLLDDSGSGSAPERVEYRLEEQQSEDNTGSRVVRLRPGLILNIAKFTSGDSYQVGFDIDQAPVQFGCLYRGLNDCTYACGEYRNQTHHLETGCNGIYYLPRTKGILVNAPRREMCVVGILAAPSLLLSYFKDDLDMVPIGLRRVLEGNQDRQFLWYGSRSPAKQGILGQLLDCPFSGAFGKFHLETKVLELISWQLRECLESSRAASGPSMRLSRGDEEKIRHACRILIADLENPPNLPALARLVGTNEKKLKYGFRQVFGLSVYEYFRQYRLEKARRLLASGEMNVSEAAVRVGYISLGHFSRSFRRSYGLNPKDYQKANLARN
jgi:AraC-like DNA-binding protein